MEICNMQYAMIHSVDILSNVVDDLRAVWILLEMFMSETQYGLCCLCKQPDSPSRSVGMKQLPRQKQNMAQSFEDGRI